LLRLSLKAGAKVQLLFYLASLFENFLEKILSFFTHSIYLRTWLLLGRAKIITFLSLANFLQVKFLLSPFVCFSIIRMIVCSNAGAKVQPKSALASFSALYFTAFS